MSQGTTIKGKTASEQSVAVKVDTLGRLFIADGGFDPSLNITTDISTPGLIIETDGVRTLTTTITATTITEVWS